MDTDNDMATRYIKVYNCKEYKDELKKLQEEGYKWGNGHKLIYKNGQPSIPFKYPKALVVYEDKFVYIDEIRHCPDPSDRRLEATNLKVGDQVMLTDRYVESESHTYGAWTRTLCLFRPWWFRILRIRWTQTGLKGI